MQICVFRVDWFLFAQVCLHYSCDPANYFQGVSIRVGGGFFTDRMDEFVRKRIESLISNVTQKIISDKSPIVSLRYTSSKPYRFCHTSFIRGSLRLGLYASRSRITIACLLRIIEILLVTPQNCRRTKRDIYYMDTNLFENQRRVDRLIDVLACTLNVPRDSLGVSSSPKGLAFGDLEISSEETLRLNFSHSPTLISREGVKGDITSTAKIVIVVEKEAVFSLLWQKYAELKAVFSSLIVITGRGYPDLITMQLLHRLMKASTETKFFALVDFDPFGLDIALRYRCGSKLPSDQPTTSCDRLELLGILLPQLDRYCHQNRANGNRQGLSKLGEYRLRSVIRQGELSRWEALISCGNDMLACGFTAEIESIYQHDSDTLLKYCEQEIKICLHS